MQASPIASEDAAAARDIGARGESGFTQNDAELLMRDIAATTSQCLEQPYLRGSRVHYRGHGIAMLAPRVTVAHKPARSTEEAATRGDTPEMTALDVFARRFTQTDTHVRPRTSTD
ncbi:MAG: hypothetical protein ACTH31_01780 [Pseudoclavibacter sp.]